jgi:hypothetical protein
MCIIFTGCSAQSNLEPDNGSSLLQSGSNMCEYIEKMEKVINGPELPKDLFPNIKSIRNFYDGGQSINKYFNEIIGPFDKIMTVYCIKKYNHYCNKKYCFMAFYYKHPLGFPTYTYLRGRIMSVYDLNLGIFVQTTIGHKGD